MKTKISANFRPLLPRGRLRFYAGGTIRPIVPSRTPFADFIPRRRGNEIPQQFAAFVRRLIKQRKLLPGNKIIPAEFFAQYLRGQGFPVAGNTLNLGLQQVAREGKIVYVNGSGLENQGPGYYVFDAEKYSFSKILQTTPLPVLGKSQVRAAIIRDILQNRLAAGTAIPLDHQMHHVLGVKNKDTAWHLVSELQKLGFLQRDPKRAGTQYIYRVTERPNFSAHVQGRVVRLIKEVQQAGFSLEDSQTILALAANLRITPKPSPPQLPQVPTTETLGHQMKLGLEQTSPRQKRQFLIAFLRRQIFSGLLQPGSTIEGPYAFTQIAGRRFQGLIYTAMMQLVEDGLLQRPKGVERGQFLIAPPQIAFDRAVRDTRNHFQVLHLQGYDLDILKPFIEALVSD